MSDILDVAVICGSLRRDSFTHRLALAMAGMAPSTLRLQVVPIGALPLYNPDDETNPPIPWREFRDRVTKCAGILFATPEYNRSVPGALKNAIDVGSRPYGRSVWGGKPAAIVSCSPGAMGGFGANHHLRQSLVFLNMPTLQQPEAYIGGVDKLLGPDNTITNPDTHKFLLSLLAAFEQWIRQQQAEAN